ncbi:MAG: cupin, partial [Alphaproteobacteria bacterium]
PRDLVRTPAGRDHFIRNPGAGHATLWTVIGSAGDDGAVYRAG